MNKPLTRFNATQVQNGWMLAVSGDIGCIAETYVFSSLAEMADWLKVQVERDPAKAE